MTDEHEDDDEDQARYLNGAVSANQLCYLASEAHERHTHVGTNAEITAAREAEPRGFLGVSPGCSEGETLPVMLEWNDRKFVSDMLFPPDDVGT